MKDETIKQKVRERYARVAKQGKSCCAPTNSCCGSASLLKLTDMLSGYTEEELKAIPEGANLGLGCGNPVAIASLKPGEVVLDLGSGAGVDCFLAANQVGESGKVIGVDMTPEMIRKARANVRKGNYRNVEFKPGEIDNLSLADNSVDVIISNCVINLAPDKGKVFKEAFRVLRPGGRIMVSDLVLVRELPEFIKNSMEAYASCVAGAMLKDDYIGAIKGAGFTEVRIRQEVPYPLAFVVSEPEVKTFLDAAKLSTEMVESVSNSVVSVKVYGVKPSLQT